MSGMDIRILKWLAGQRPIWFLIDDPQALEEDPLCYLQEQSIVIGRPFPAIQTMIVCALITFGIFLYIRVLPSFSVALLVFACLTVLFLVPQLFLIRHYLVLTDHGIEIGTGTKHLFVPWTVIQIPQTPFLRNKRSADFAIRSEFVDQIELHRHGEVVATGKAARVLGAKLHSKETLRLSGWYRAAWVELVEFLPFLAAEITGRPLDHDDDSAEQRTTPILNERVSVVEARNRAERCVKLPITNFILPERCCVCLDDEPLWKEVESTGVLLIRQGRSVEIPYCRTCWRNYRKKYAALIAGVVLVFAVAGIFIGLFFNATAGWVAGLVSMIIFAAPIAVIADRYICPCYLQYFNSKKNRVRLYVRSDEYRALIQSQRL